MSNLLTVSGEQLKRIGLNCGIVMILAGLAYIVGVLPTLTSNPLVLAVLLALVNYLQDYFTDEQGRLGGKL
jgi:hypothetical protein